MTAITRLDSQDNRRKAILSIKDSYSADVKHFVRFLDSRNLDLFRPSHDDGLTDTILWSRVRPLRPLFATRAPAMSHGCPHKVAVSFG